jgi:hypothetical protein
MINNLYIKATPTTASVTWGDITGTLSDQTDLQSALDAKFDEPTGTVSQYVRGDGSLATLPTSLPPTGAAGGDLTGTYPNPTVHRVHGVDFQSGTPAVDDTWIYVSTPLGPQPFQWQHSKLKTSQVQNDSTVTGTNTDDALEHLDSTKVPTTRTISTTAPLSGGGDLSANRTLSITQANTSTNGFLSSTDWNTFNGKQDALTLTTTGTSGAATLVGSTLNIPQYSGGGGASGGANTPIKLGSGGIYSNTPIGANNTNASLGPNAMYLAPFIPTQNFTISDFKINVAVLGTGNYRILLYSHSDTNGLPDVLLYESSDLSVLTIGVKTATTTQTFTAGTTYWLGVYGSSTVQVVGAGVASQNQIGMDSNLSQYTSIIRNVTFGSAPNPFGTTHTKTSNTFTRIGLTVA